MKATTLTSVFAMVHLSVVLALGTHIASAARADGFDERMRRPSLAAWTKHLASGTVLSELETRVQEVAR
jgi:hypothetical protein